MKANAAEMQVGSRVNEIWIITSDLFLSADEKKIYSCLINSPVFIYRWRIIVSEFVLNKGY